MPPGRVAYPEEIAVQIGESGGPMGPDASTTQPAGAARSVASMDVVAAESEQEDQTKFAAGSVASMDVVAAESEQEDRTKFMAGLSQFYASDPKKLKCKMNKADLDWAGLYFTVEALGGYDEVVARGKQGWLEACQQGCPANYSRRNSRPKKIQQKYEAVLRPYAEEHHLTESRERLRLQVAAADRLLEERILDDDGEDGAEEQTSIQQQLTAIVKQLLAGVQHYKDDTAGRGEPTASKASADFMLCESLQDLLGDVMGTHLVDSKSELKSIAFFGPNRLGKSTLLDLLLQVGQLSAKLYSTKNKRGVDLEAYGHLDGDDAEEFLVGHDEHFDKAGKLRQDERWSDIRARDDHHKQVYRQFCKKGLPDATTIHPFLLPHGHEGETLTNRPIRIRFGTKYHLVVKYKTLEALQDEIMSVQWDAYEDQNDPEVDSVNTVTPDGKLCQLYIQNRLALLNSLRGPPRDMATVFHGADSSSEEDSDDDDDDDDDDDEGTTMDDAEEGDKPPERPHSKDDIVICDEITQLLGRTRIYCGAGCRIDDDRLYIQQMLQNELNVLDGKRADGVQTHCAIDEVTLYVPNVLLQGGVEWMDTPGTTDSDPLKKLHMIDCLEEADVVLALMPDTGLQGNAEVEALLQEHVIPRVFGTNGRTLCSLHFLHLDEKRHKSTAKITCSDEAGGWTTTVHKPADAARKGTEKRYLELLSKEFGDSMNTAQLKTKHKQSRFVCTRPLLYSSLVLNRLSNPNDLDLTPDMYTKAMYRTRGSDLLSLVFYAGLGDTKSSLERIKMKVEDDIDKISENLDSFLPSTISDSVRKQAKDWSKKKSLARHFRFFEAVDGLRKELLEDIAPLTEVMQEFERLSNAEIDASYRELVEKLDRAAARSRTSYLKAFEKELKGSEAVLPLRKIRKAAVKSLYDQALNQSVKGAIDTFKVRICEDFKDKLIIVFSEAATAEKDVLQRLATQFTEKRFGEQLEDALAPLRKSMTVAVREIRGKSGIVAKAFQAEMFCGMKPPSFYHSESYTGHQYPGVSQHRTKWKRGMKAQFEVNKQAFSERLHEDVKRHLQKTFSLNAKKCVSKVAPLQGRGTMVKAFAAFLRSVWQMPSKEESEPPLQQLKVVLQQSAHSCEACLKDMKHYDSKKSKYAQDMVLAMRIMHGLSDDADNGDERSLGLGKSWEFTVIAKSAAIEMGVDDLVALQQATTSPAADSTQHTTAANAYLAHQMQPPCTLGAPVAAVWCGQGSPQRLGPGRSLYYSLVAVAADRVSQQLKVRDTDLIELHHKCFRQLLNAMIESPKSKKAQESFEKRHKVPFIRYLNEHFAQGTGEVALQMAAPGDAAIIETFCSLFKKSVCVHYLPPGQHKMHVYRIEDPRARKDKAEPSGRSTGQAYHIYLAPDMSSFRPIHREFFTNKESFKDKSFSAERKLNLGWQLVPSNAYKNMHYWHHEHVHIEEYFAWETDSKELAAWRQWKQQQQQPMRLDLQLPPTNANGGVLSPSAQSRELERRAQQRERERRSNHPRTPRAPRFQMLPRSKVGGAAAVPPAAKAAASSKVPTTAPCSVGRPTVPPTNRSAPSAGAGGHPWPGASRPPAAGSAAAASIPEDIKQKGRRLANRLSIPKTKIPKKSSKLRLRQKRKGSGAENTVASNKRHDCGMVSSPNFT